MISDCWKRRDKLLQAAHGSEALHHAFSFSQRQMGIFRAIVETVLRPRAEHAVVI
jgi:hypothetical protein